MDINTQLEEIKARLQKIESHLGFASAKLIPEPLPTSQPKVEIVAQPSTPPQSKSFSSSRLLGAVSVIFLILACSFIIKLAIDAGWLTPMRQLGIAAIIGSSLIAGGLLLKENDKEYSSFLPAAGIIILYLTVFSAHLIYHFIGPVVAINMSGMLSLLSLWLFTQFRSDIFPISSAAGSYLVPVLSGFLWGDLPTVSLYFLGWTLTYAVLSIYVHSRTLSIVAAYFGIGIFGMLCLDETKAGNVWFPTVQLLQFIILLAGTIKFSMLNRSPLAHKEALAYYPILLFFYASEYEILNKALLPAPYFMLALAGLLAAGYWIAQKTVEGVKSSKALVEAYCLITLFHSLYLNLLADDAKPLLFIAFLAAGVFLRSNNVTASFSITSVLVSVIVVLSEYARLIHQLVRDDRTLNNLGWVVYGAIASLLLIMKGISRGKNTSSSGMFAFICGHSLFVATLYSVFEPAGSIPLSIAWTAYASAVLYYGFINRLESLAKSSLVVLFFAVAKVFIYDTSNASPIIRIICLFVTGIVVYGCGALLRKIEAWK